MLASITVALGQDQNSSDRKLPDSPSAVVAQSATPQPATPQQFQQPQTAPQPLGTAAAPAITTTGVAGATPAGAAIAPAKQRRVRTILISVGAVLGAGIAVGTVAALSSGSPSKPPGSH